MLQLATPKETPLKYNMISNEHLRTYLNEFYYRLNRRYFGKKLINQMAAAIGAN
jgi:hypothetical protein